VLGARAAYAARADDPKLLLAAYRALEALPEPRREERLELLGQLAEIAKLHDEAREWYEQIPRGPRYLAAQMRIAVILDEQGKHDEAIEYLVALRAAGIDEDERLADTYLLEGELLLRAKNEPAALAAYAAGLKALPDDRRLLYGRAIAFEQMDKVDESIADLRRIVELNPDDADSLNALGYTLADRTDRYEEALALIEKAAAAKPDEPAIMDSLGWAQFRLQRYDEAVTNLRRAYAQQPDAEIAAHLGEALWVSGQKDEARRVFAEGRKKDAENLTLLRTIERLKP
jgi:tetratricopeptide (TPR) repeat protein